MRIPPSMPSYIPESSVRPTANAGNALANAAAAVAQAVNNQTESGLLNIDAQTIGECETCNSRRYQDDSLDGGVSFQEATHIHPNEAASEVFGHEREHQGRERRFAEEDGREVILNEIRVHTSVCPDCGRVYVSGGETRTITRSGGEQEQEPMSLFDALASRN